MSGTLDAEAEHRRKMLDYEQRKKAYEQRKKAYERENEKLDVMILRTKNENARLAELESKIDGLFSKYNIKLPQEKPPDQP